MKLDFVCNQNDNEDIPKKALKKGDADFVNVHIKGEYMAYTSKKLKEIKKDVICKLPFCTTVEAEAFGANINLGDKTSSPRLRGYSYNSLEELKCLKSIDLTSGRIKEVLNGVKYLGEENEVVCLNVCGPLTIISLLVDPKVFFKGVRKDKESVDKFLKIIEDSIVSYIVKGNENGASIISYSDPFGDIDIIGAKNYKNILADITSNIIKKAQSELTDSIIHLCGRTTKALYEAGYCNILEIKSDNNLKYGEVICDFLKEKNTLILGNNCMKKTPYKLNTPIVYKIEFNK